MAIYNNGFPATYPQMYYPTYQQPIYQMPQQQPMQQQSTQQPSMAQPITSDIKWVQGEAGAKSYLVAPNNTVQLWDSERQTIYLKSADASGMPSMKILDYTIRESQTVNTTIMANTPQNSQPVNPPNYATKDDVNALNDQITGLRAEIDSLTIKKAAPKPKREATDDE